MPFKYLSKLSSKSSEMITNYGSMKMQDSCFLFPYTLWYCFLSSVSIIFIFLIYIFVNTLDEAQGR